MKKISPVKFSLYLCAIISSIYSNIPFAEGFEQFKNYYFVESGTFGGEGCELALKAGFKEIHSIEIDAHYVQENKERLAGNKNVHIWHGDSGKILWDVIKNLDKPITFWLDGHNGFPDQSSNEKNTPLLEELDQIKQHPIKNHTILIDDMHCCQTAFFDFITKEEIVKKIFEINPHYTISYIQGGKYGEYPNNILVAQCMSKNQACDTQAAKLIDHVITSIKNADLGISKINNEILKLEGLSSPKVRHFLNNICSLPNGSYLEIGTWKGSTFISALYNNQSYLKKAIGLDNWSEFGGHTKALFESINKFLSKEDQHLGKFFEGDCFNFDKALIDNPINIYFYDGNHSYESHKKAFTYFNDVLDEVFIAIIDDWNWDAVQKGTHDAFAELNYKILFEEHLPAHVASDTENWWNGLCVAVISKP